MTTLDTENNNAAGKTSIDEANFRLNFWAPRQRNAAQSAAQTRADHTEAAAIVASIKPTDLVQVHFNSTDKNFRNIADTLLMSYTVKEIKDGVAHIEGVIAWDIYASLEKEPHVRDLRFVNPKKAGQFLCR